VDIRTGEAGAFAVRGPAARSVPARAFSARVSAAGRGCRHIGLANHFGPANHFGLANHVGLA
jgi:hypothetical protein